MKSRLSAASVILIVVVLAASGAWAAMPFQASLDSSGDALALSSSGDAPALDAVAPGDLVPQGIPAPLADFAEPLQLPAGAGGAGNYVQFDEPTHNLDESHGYPVTGGHSRYGWDVLEPNYDGDYRFDEYILPWVQQEVNRGKKVGIGFVTYNGRAGGGIDVPPWLWARDSNVRLYNTLSNDGWYVLNYLNQTYIDEYEEMIIAFANWVAANPVVRNNLAWVETGTGLYGENQPTADNWIEANGQDWDYYRYHAPKPAGGNGWGVEWIDHVDAVNQFYRDAFDNAGLTGIVLFTNVAPTFMKAAWERDAVADYAAQHGIGLKHNGLLADHNNALDSYSPMRNWYNSGTKVPICWEVYGPETGFATPAADWYWTVLAGLEWHPDYFLPTRGLFTYASHLPSTELAQRYSGVTLATTPDVWVALRETFRVDTWDNPIFGNYEFWLYQDDDVFQGRTVTETNRYDAITDDVTNRLGLPVYNPNLGSAKEGWTTRRTSYADGNPYMFFNIDDGYLYGGPAEATIQVTYFDWGIDKWSLIYDSTTGDKHAVPDGSGDPWVQKTDSRTWKTATFNIVDGRFQNAFPGGNDFRIDCRDDGDEWIHMVRVGKEGGYTPSPTATPTVTPTPTGTPSTGPIYIQLRQGANLIAYPGSAKPVADALASIAGKYTKVYSAVYEFNGSEYVLIWKTYLTVLPPELNSLTQLDSTHGYWIYVSEDCVLTVNP